MEAGETMTTPHIRDYPGKHIHMIGIGGSSMSGLAQMLQEKGYVVTGSDNLETYATSHLRDDLGIPVTIGHKAENVHGADLVVYTIAILPDNPGARRGCSAQPAQHRTRNPAWTADGGF